VTVASHDFAGAADRLAGARFGTYRKRATAVGASCTAFTRVVVITGCSQWSRVQGAGATIAGVGALVIGQAGVDAEVVDAAKSFRAGFHRASSTVEAEIRINALAAIAKRRTSALTGNARFAVIEANTVIVLSTRLTRFTGIRLVTSNACAAWIVRVTSWSYATCLILWARIIVTCAVVPITRSFGTADRVVTVAEDFASSKLSVATSGRSEVGTIRILHAVRRCRRSRSVGTASPAQAAVVDVAEALRKL
jgi:hypothetical protein